MALLRIFQRRRKPLPTVSPLETSLDEAADSQCNNCLDPEFPPECLRLVIFREGDRKERRLLFDSSCVRPRRCSEGSIEAVPAKLNGRIAHSHSNPSGFFNYTDDIIGSRGLQSDKKFEVTRAPADTKVIGEMMFGAVSMSYKGETLKLHELRSPSKLLLTKVFPGPKYNNRQSHPVISESSDGSDSKFFESCNTSNPDHSDSDRDSQYSTVHSLNELVTFSVPSKSVPICIPEQSRKSSPSSSSPSMERSGLVTRSTSHNSLKNAVLSPGSCKSLPGTPLSHSLQRRWLLNSSMNLEFGLKLRSNDQLDEEGNSVYHGSRQRRCQIGIGVMINFPDNCDPGVAERLRHFIFSHIFVIETALDRLKEEVTKACLYKTLFINITCKAWTTFCLSFEQLFTLQRLSGPVWLSLMSQESNADVIADRFLSVLVNLVTQFDVKNTNFFVSTLLTAVLLNHLTWVTSVIPVTSVGIHRMTTVPSSSKKRKSQWIENRDISHPYNPLWMQFLDAIGGTSLPSKISRFLVTGNKSECVNHFIYLLSYFLRCSEVNEQIVEDLVGKEFGEEKIRLQKQDRLSRTPSLSTRSRHSSNELHKLPSPVKVSEDLLLSAKELPRVKALKCRENVSATVVEKPTHCKSRSNESDHSFSQEQAKELAEKLTKLQNNRDLRGDGCYPDQFDWQGSVDACCPDAPPGTSGEQYVGSQLPSSSVDEPLRPLHKMARRRSGGENFAGMERPDALNPFFVRHKQLRLSGSSLSNRAFGHQGVLKQRNLSCPVIRSQNSRLSTNSGDQRQNTADVSAKACTGDAPSTSSPPRSVLRSVPVSRKVSTSGQTSGSCGRFDVFPISAPVNIFEPMQSSSTVSSQCTIRCVGSVDSCAEKRGSKDSEAGDIMDLTLVSQKTSMTVVSTRKTSLGYGTGADPSVSASILGTKRTSESLGLGESAGDDQVDSDCYHLDFEEANRSDADSTSMADQNQSILEGHLTKSSVDSGIEENDAMDYMRQEHKQSLHQIVFGSAKMESLPNVSVVRPPPKSQAHDGLVNLGRSVLAPFGDSFRPHCVLSGCRPYGSLVSEISEELIRQATSLETKEAEPIESMCVIADTTNWCVKVMSTQLPSGQQNSFVGPSNLIISMMENVRVFRQMNFPASFCLTYIEDCLAELHLKSCTLLRYLEQFPVLGDSQKIADVVGCDVSDLPLLISVASSHSPEILCLFDS